MRYYSAPRQAIVERDEPAHTGYLRTGETQYVIEVDGRTFAVVDDPDHARRLRRRAARTGGYATVIPMRRDDTGSTEEA